MPAVRIPFLPKYESIRKPTPDGQRQYDTPIGLVPSVTTVLSGSRDNTDLELWRAHVGEERADEITAAACYRGDLHHKLIEDYLLHGTQPKLNMVSERYWKSTADFLTTIDRAILCEGCVWHPKGYAGAFDCLAYLKDDDGTQPTLLDWKTADRPRKPDKMYDYKCQVAAYVAAANWVYAKQGLDIQRAKIVVAICNSQPQIEVVERDSLNQLFDHFLARLERFYIK